MGTVCQYSRQGFHSQSQCFVRCLLRRVVFHLIYLIMLFALGDQQPLMEILADLIKLMKRERKCTQPHVCASTHSGL